MLGYEYEIGGEKKSWKLKGEEINGCSKVFLENLAVTCWT